MAHGHWEWPPNQLGLAPLSTHAGISGYLCSFASQPSFPALPRTSPGRAGDALLHKRAQDLSSPLPASIRGLSCFSAYPVGWLWPGGGCYLPGSQTRVQGVWEQLACGGLRRNQGQHLPFLQPPAPWARGMPPACPISLTSLITELHHPFVVHCCLLPRKHLYTCLRPFWTTMTHISSSLSSLLNHSSGRGSEGSFS